jgi:hypothetical protein
LNPVGLYANTEPVASGVYPVRLRLSEGGPAEDINLHFRGDFRAVTAAHNLLAAALVHLQRPIGQGFTSWQQICASCQYL